MPKLSHYGKRGQVQMVDVSAKQVTTRTAKAHGFVRMKPRVVSSVRPLTNPKSNPLEFARMPAIAVAAASATGPQAMSAARGKTTVKLLLVEENPLVLELVFRGIEHVCDIRVAHDGGDALLKAVDDPPHVILSDYKMPGLDGRQLFDKLRSREKTRHIPFLFMSSRADIEQRLRPLVDGVEEFIAKPFLVKDLVRITKKVVDRLHLEKMQKHASRPGS